MLRRIFTPKREEVAGGWRKIRNKELHKLYGSLSLSWSNEGKCDGQVRRQVWGRWEIYGKNWSQNLKGRDYFEALTTVAKIIRQFSLKKHFGRVWTGFIWLGIGISGGLLCKVMDLRVPQKAGNLLTGWVTI